MLKLRWTALIAVIVIGIFLAYASQSRDDAPIYHTALIERGDLVSTVTAYGTVNAVTTVEVGSQLSGQVAELLVDFNDAVRTGQPLARIDPQSFEAAEREAAAELESARAELLRKQAAVEQAIANAKNARNDRDVAKAKTDNALALYAEAERTVERGRKLANKGSFTRSELERMETQREALLADLEAAKAQHLAKEAAIQSAEAAIGMARAEVEVANAMIKQRAAALEKARIALARTFIRAPIDGVVVGRNVDLGQTVAASLQAPTLFTIAEDLRRMQVETNVDEADIGQVKPGQRVSFSVDAYRGQAFEGQVVQIRKQPLVFQNVVTYTVVISADNADLLLLPGMSATVLIVVAEKIDVLKAPNAALRFRLPGQKHQVPDAAQAQSGETIGAPGVVWQLDKTGVPTPVAIRTGASDAGAYEIVSGDLTEGQSVIIGATLPKKTPRIIGLRWGF